MEEEGEGRSGSDDKHLFLLVGDSTMLLVGCGFFFFLDQKCSSGKTDVAKKKI